MRAAPSQYVRSAALPAPTPLVLVGVFTLRGGRGGKGGGQSMRHCAVLCGRAALNGKGGAARAMHHPPSRT
jgi:hypothetical protein